MKNENKFEFTLKGLKFSETCKFYFDFPKTMDFNLFIELCDRGKLHTSFGTKDDPKIATAYEYTWETTEWAGKKMYVVLNEFRGKRTFQCFTLVEEDVKELISSFAIQYMMAFATAA